MQTSFLHFVFQKKTTKNTSTALLRQTRGRKRKNSRVGGDFHARSCTQWSGVKFMMIIDTWKLKLFLASTLGAQLQAIIFFLFPAAMDFWPIGIFERYYANLLHGKFDYILHCNITRTFFWRFVQSRGTGLFTVCFIVNPKPAELQSQCSVIRKLS